MPLTGLEITKSFNIDRAIALLELVVKLGVNPLLKVSQIKTSRTHSNGQQLDLVKTDLVRPLVNVYS